MTNKKIILILLIILTCFVLFRFSQYLTPQKSSVIQTSPQIKETNVNITSSIIISFDSPVGKNINIITNPNFFYTQSTNPTKSELVLLPNSPFLENTIYQISLSGKNINPFTLQFTTGAQPKPTLVPEITPPQNQISEDVLSTVISKLPIITPQYTIQYFSKTKQFVVLILQNPYEQNVKQVENWFALQGVTDLSKLNIQYGSSRGVAPQ